MNVCEKMTASNDEEERKRMMGKRWFAEERV
jgi:hypothetical protein